MGVKVTGTGPKGPKGDRGDTGAAGASSTVPGPRGDKGDTGAPGPASTVPGPKGDKGDPGAASTVPGPAGPTGPAGPAGSNAAATPLGTATPRALAATAVAGSSGNASREDHVHPLPTGLLQFVGNVIVQRTLVLSLSSGMQREYVALTGIVPADRLMFACIAACSAGCAPINVYPDTGRVLFEYNTPALGIGASVNLQIAVYRVAS